MLIHVVADYGAGDLAFAEVAQRLALHLKGATVVATPVPPFDTLSAGFCIGQLALTEGPADRVVFHNVAPRADEDDPRPGNEGEELVAAWTDAGTLEVADRELSFAPGSSGWPLASGEERRFYELLLRGGSAAELFGGPAA